MNSKIGDFNNENHFDRENDSFQEKALGDKTIGEMAEEIEFLREQVESLKQALYHESQLTEEYRQELAFANQELEWMNEELNNLVASDILSLDEPKEVAKSVVEEKNAPNQVVAELINSVDYSPEEVNESGQLDSSNIRSKVEQFAVQSRETKARSLKLQARFSRNMAHSSEIVTRSREIRVHSVEVKNQFGKANVSHDVSHRHEMTNIGASAC